MNTSGNLEFLSKEQFCKICHIRKSTALRLIENQLIPVIDTHKKTKRYLIAKDDVELFIRDREQHPEKYSLGNCNKIQTNGGFRDYQPSVAVRMRKLAQAKLTHLPDMLSVSNVSELLGYRKETIYRWCKKYELKGFKVAGKRYISKSSLLCFIASREFHGIQHKSKQHIDFLRRSTYEWR